MRIARIISFTLALSAAPCFAGSDYELTINTSSASGTTGFIDLTFNGGFPASAEIDSFTGAPLNSATLFTQGTVSGTLPGVVTLSDDNADYNEGLTFGSSIRFLLTFAGTPGGSTGDLFAISFFASDDATPLFTANENDGFLAEFALDTRGGVTPTAFNNPSGGPSDADITPVPEPALAIPLLLALGLIRLPGRLWRAAVSRR